MPQKSCLTLQWSAWSTYVIIKYFNILAFPEVITTSLSKVDIDIRSYLYQHILLSGGNTMFKGLPEKLTNEVKKLAPKHMKVKLHAPSNRKNSCWYGASIIASLDSFKNMWVTRSV